MADFNLKIEEVLKDEAFVERLFSTDAPEDAQKIFAEAGIEISIEDVIEIANQIKDNSDELGENALEDVSGGSATAVAILGCVVACGKLYLSARKAWDAKW